MQATLIELDERERMAVVWALEGHLDSPDWLWLSPEDAADSGHRLAVANALQLLLNEGEVPTDDDLAIGMRNALLAAKGDAIEAAEDYARSTVAEDHDQVDMVIAGADSLIRRADLEAVTA